MLSDVVDLLVHVGGAAVGVGRRAYEAADTGFYDHQVTFG